MIKGQVKYVLCIQNKGEDKLIYVSPDELDKTFLEMGVQNSSDLTLVNINDIQEDMDDEGGEDGEEEQEEMNDDGAA